MGSALGEGRQILLLMGGETRGEALGREVVSSSLEFLPPEAHAFYLFSPDPC